MTAGLHQRLTEQLREAQRIGIIGPTSVDTEITHALHYVPGIPPDARDVVDFGSGAGLPALVIALECPGLHILLVERRQKRSDFLHRAVRSLGLSDRVSVHAGDIAPLRRSRRGEFDLVTARAFGPPRFTLQCAADLLRPGGTVLVSLPPDSSTLALSAACEESSASYSLLDQGVVAAVTGLPSGFS